MTAVTNLGLLRTRLDERLAQLVADYKSVFGDDIQVNPDDIDGQMLGLFAQALNDLDSLAEVVYNSFNPQSATGLALKRLVQLNGIKYIAGAYSAVDVTITGQQGTFIPLNSLVKDNVTGVKWATQTDVTIGASGISIVTCLAVDKGAIAAAAGSISKIDTPIFGWQTVTNVNPATVGRDEETDEQLRIRRAKSTATPGQCIIDAVFGSLANLVGVRLVRVYENDKDAVDVNGQAPHSIYCVVEGGVVADIAQLIWLKKTAGTTTIGTLPIVILDSQGSPHTINFDRPVYTDVYITVNVTKHAGYPSNGAALMKQALVDYGQTLVIGDDIEQPRLYTPVNTVKNHKITGLFIGTAPGPVGIADIAVPYNGLARIDASRIVVVES